MIRKDWDNYFFDIARLVSGRATCPRRRVGAVVVWNKQGSSSGYIISTGYNGSNPGQGHCDDIGCLLSKDGSCIRTIHAEENALNFVIEHFKVPPEELTIYCTVKPCWICSSLIENVFPGIKVKYIEEYR